MLVLTFHVGLSCPSIEIETKQLMATSAKPRRHVLKMYPKKLCIFFKKAGNVSLLLFLNVVH